MIRALYEWLMNAVLGRLAASAAMKVSAAADAQDAETRAELSRRADELEKAGHKEEAAALRASAARLSLQSPVGQAQPVFLPISLEVGAPPGPPAAAPAQLPAPAGLTPESPEAARRRGRPPKNQQSPLPSPNGEVSTTDHAQQ